MKSMKKFLAIMLVLTMVLSVTACGTSVDNHLVQGEQSIVQNVSKEDAADVIKDDKISVKTETEDVETGIVVQDIVQENTTEPSAVIGSDTKKETISTDDSNKQIQQNEAVNLNKIENTSSYIEK